MDLIEFKKDKRVSHYLEDLPEGWQDIALDIFKEGGYVIEVLVRFGFSYSTHGRFMNENDEYKEIFDIGEMLAKAWWMEVGRTAIKKSAKDFNLGMYAFHMKNRYKWRDTPLTDTGSGKVIPDKETEAEIRGKYEKRDDRVSVVVN